MNEQSTQEVAVPLIDDMYSVVKITPVHGFVEVRGYIRKGTKNDPLNLLEFKNNVITVHEPGMLARWFSDTIEKRILWSAAEMRRRTFREIRKRRKEKERDARLKQIVQRMGQANEDSPGT